MLYYSFLKQERDKKSELWVRRSGQLWPVFDYKIKGDFISLISDPDVSVAEAVTLEELIEYVGEEGCSVNVLYQIIDELTGQDLDIKDRFSHKLVFEICN